MKYKNQKKGFTLIELLVVVAIISLLASIVMASLNSARDKAKDASVMATVRELQKALELYRDQFGTYPATSGGGVDAWDIGGSTAFTDTLAPLVTARFITKISDHPDWPNNADNNATGFFEYETDLAEYPDGSHDKFVCGSSIKPTDGYVLLISNRGTLNLPHFGHLHSDGSITDESLTFTSPLRYYCVVGG